MRIFDLHADIGPDVLNQHHLGKDNVLLTRHSDKCLKGEVSAIAMASFFSGKETYEEMQEMILTLENELDHQNVWQRVLSGNDLKSDRPLALMSVEGMCGIKENECEAIEWMYEHGIRLASLCWNEENALASGVKGNPDHGLSEMGRNVISKMDELHMVIDVSHANEKTFWDILDCSKGFVIATHSNAYTLCNHPRNLKDEQIRAIAAKGGLIGMNSCAYFIDHDLTKVTVDALAKHAAYIKNLVGIDHLACGFDFMDFFGEEDADYIINDMKDASYAQNFIQALKNNHFSDCEIKKIAYQNVIDRFSQYLR